MKMPERFHCQWHDIPLIIRLLIHRVNYRGGALLFFAFLDFVVGSSLLTDPPNTAGYRVIDTLPYSVWAFLWLAVSAICAVQAFARKNDAYGFLAAASIKFLWSFGFLLAWLEHGAYRAEVAASTWFVFGLFVLLISGWKDPDKRQG
jgi:hypothetical protein